MFTLLEKLLNFASFALVFFIVQVVLVHKTDFSDFTITLLTLLITTISAPTFRVEKIGFEKLDIYLDWLSIKDIKIK